MPSFQTIGQNPPNAGVLTSSITATIGLTTFTTCQLGTLTHCEIANLSTTAAAAFCFTVPTTVPGANGPVLTPATSATVATTAMRTIPPDTVLYEYLPGGCNFASAIAVSGAPTLTFTGGQWSP